MNQIIKALLAYVLSWMFFYPLTLAAIPLLNSKMIAAVFGICFYVWDVAKHGAQINIDRHFLVLTTFAIVFSIFCFGSSAINGTDDYAYATYFVTMFVWLSAAFASMRSIKWAHGYASVRLVATYIVMLCVGQCIMALLIEYVPIVHRFCYTYFLVQEGAAWESRLIGLGAAFDVAGIRFSAGLLLCAALIADRSRSKLWTLCYVISYMFIAVVGNMLARTTTVGVLISMGYLLLQYVNSPKENRLNIFTIFFSCLSVAAILLPALYRMLPEFRELISFGFEGFVNYLETGTWKSRSSDILRGMWSVWPDNMKTWLIGDGYFADPDNPKLFYMDTDIGYARFTFYCGLLGFFWFLLYFIYLTWMLMNKFPQYKMMFFFFLVTLLGVWCKVSTDIFLVYAVFFFIDPNEEPSMVEYR